MCNSISCVLGLLTIAYPVTALAAATSLGFLGGWLACRRWQGRATA